MYCFLVFSFYSCIADCWPVCFCSSDQCSFILKIVLRYVRKLSMGRIQIRNMDFIRPQICWRSQRWCWLGFQFFSHQLISFLDINWVALLDLKWVGSVSGQPTEKVSPNQHYNYKLLYLQAPMQGMKQNFYQIDQTVHRSIWLANRQVFLPNLPLTILFDYFIHMISIILVHPILI